MSSTFVADSTDDRKSDDTLIIIVNADGTLSVDPDALNKLIANQHTAGVSVVRVGSGQQNEGVSDPNDGGSEDDNPHINLTVEGFYPPGSTAALTTTASALASGTTASTQVPVGSVASNTLSTPSTSVTTATTVSPAVLVSQSCGSTASIVTSSSSVTTSVTDGGVQSGGGDLVDPFSEMDSEQLKRLETALQSEQAKQILGENVTAMFDMLNDNGEQEVPLHESIRMDHCYTNLSGPSTSTAQLPAGVGSVQQVQSQEQQVLPSLQPQQPVLTTVLRGKGRGKPEGDSLSRISLASPHQKSGARLVPLLQPLLLPTSTVNTVQAGSVKPQRLILPQSKVIIAHDIGAVPGLLTQANPRVVLSRISPLTTFSVVNTTPGSGGNNTATVSTTNVELSKPKVNNRVGRGGNRGGRARGEGKKTVNVGDGSSRGSKGAKVIPELPSQVIKLDEEMAAALQAMETSPPPQTGESQTVKKKTVVRVAKKQIEKNLSLKQTLSDDHKKAVELKGVDQPEKVLLHKKVKPAKKSADSTTPSTYVAVTAATASVPTTSDPSPSHAVDISGKLVKTVDTAISTDNLGNQLTPIQQTKKYPKRENRKPPAHLAEAFGPALFSTPDIIRRVSTDKPAPPTPTNKESMEGIVDTTNICETSHEVTPIGDTSNVLMGDITDLPETSEVVHQEKSDVVTDIVSSDRTLELNNSSVLDISLTTLKDNIQKDKTVSSENSTVLTHQPDGLCVSSEPSEFISTLPSVTDTSTKLTVSVAKSVTPTTAVVTTTTVMTTSLTSSSTVTTAATQPVTTVTVTPNQQVTTPVAVGIPQALRKLPPIELPATRSASKRASLQQQEQTPQLQLQQPVQATQKQEGETPLNLPPSIAATKGKRKSSMESKVSSSRLSTSEEDLASDDEGSYNSEDDPDRLWCICRKPHNNRFMICCDSCEEWFHGKCVGITKAAGKQIEIQGIEWNCPNCKKLASEGKPAEVNVDKPGAKSHVPKPVETKGNLNEDKQAKDMKSPSTQTKQTTLKFHFDKNTPKTPVSAGVNCIVCKKPAQNESIYCGDECITKHGEESLEMFKEKGDTSSRSQQDTRVIVFERKTGRLLAGPNAPLATNLISWLKSHPTYEVVRPGQLPTSKFYTQSKGSASKPVTQQINRPHQKPSNFGLKQTVLATKPGSKHLIFSPKNPPNKQSRIVLIQPKNQPPAKSQQVSKNENVESPVTTEKIQVTKKEIQDKVQPSKKETCEIESVKKIPVIQKKLTLSVSSGSATVKTPSSKKQRRTSSTKDDAKSLPVKKLEIKKSEPSSTSSRTEEKPEPIRLNVKKTLGELLLTRVKDAGDISIEESEIEKLASHIEEELFILFKDTGTKYKSKYRSLIFNIKDPKNLTLFRKIADKSISPLQLVRLSPEEMASQELAQWREREARHQLEMIKKNELDLLQQAKTVVMKTHKGEQIIEADEGLSSKNPETSITEIESALNESVVSEPDTKEVAAVIPSKEKVDSTLNKNEKSKHKHSDVKHRRSSRNKKDDKKEKRSSDRKHRHKEHKRSHSHSRSRSRSRSRNRKSSESRKSIDSRRRSDRDKDKDKDKDDKSKIKKEPTDSVTTSVIGSPVLPVSSVDIETKVDIVKDHDSDMSDREPSSTVIIKTPPYEEKTVLWKGTLNMTDVADFQTTIHEVSGDCEFLENDLPEKIDCVGRINPDTVWDYISKIKKSGTKQIIVIRFGADNEEDKMSLLSLYSYLSSRNRMGVVGNHPTMIKDFYLFPLGSHCPIPQVLLPLDGPGFEDYRPHILLGIIVRTRRKRIMTERDIPFVPKPIKKLERSYTPPLPDADGHIPSITTTPAASSPRHDSNKDSPELTSPLDIEDGDEPYSPGGGVDEDIPYSPGGGDDDIVCVSTSPSLDLQRKMDELNRKIEEQKQQIQTISSAIEGSPDDMVTSLVSKTDDEAYSPSRSFTPPPQQSLVDIPFLDSNNIPSDISIPSNLQEILASIKKVEEPTSKTLDLKYDPIVQAYSKSDEPYSPDDKLSSLPLASSETHLQAIASPEEDSSQASTVMSKDSIKDSVTKVNRDPRQRNESVKKSSLSQLTDAELIKKAAEMGFINKDDKKVTEMGFLNTDENDEDPLPDNMSVEQEPPPPGLEEEYDIRIGDNQNLMYPMNQPSFPGFPVHPPPNIGAPVLPHGPIGQPIMPPIGPPPPIVMHGPQLPVGSMPPPMFPQPGFVSSAPVFHQVPPPLPPPPPSAPPPPPPPPPTGTPFPPVPFNPQPPLPHHRTLELSSQEHNTPGTSKLKQTVLKPIRMKRDLGKRKHYDASDDSVEKPDRKKSRDTLGGDNSGGVWKREVPPMKRDFRSSGKHFGRDHRSGVGGGFSGRNNRGRGFEQHRGRGNFFRNYSQSQRNYQSNAPPGSIQSEWDEEIRNFEQNRERRHKKVEKNRHWNRGNLKGKKRKYSPEGNE